MSATERIAALHAEAAGAIAQAADTGELEELRVRYLGRKAELPQLLRGVAGLEPAQRGIVGRAANEARRALDGLIASREALLEADELDHRLRADRVDVTLPGDPPAPVGRLHLLTQTRREIEDVFIGLGFSIALGPEIELVEYNFDALNHDATHPARARSDTFYVSAAGDVAGVGGSSPAEGRAESQVLLRTHTSPMQVRVMAAQPPPLYVIVPGRVFRPDNDATHTPQFHQVEGLAVDEGVTLADLKGTLLAFAQAIFGDEREVLLRPHFFPFTEPSVEVDVSCFACARGWRPDGSRCNLCKGSGWLEVLGAGMVDPNVFAHVGRLRGDGRDVYDPDRVQGFAFGLGVERIAMLKHGVPDLRLFYDNDVRFLEQF